MAGSVPAPGPAIASRLGFAAEFAVARLDRGENVFRRAPVSAALVAYLDGLYAALRRTQPAQERALAARWRITHVLGASDDPSAAERLAAIMQDAGEGDWVRFGAVRALVEVASRCQARADAAKWLDRVIAAMPGLPAEALGEVCDVAELAEGTGPAWWAEDYRRVLEAGLRLAVGDATLPWTARLRDLARGRRRKGSSVSEQAVSEKADWDARFMALARHIGDWSKDRSTKVGCVIVGPDNDIRATGFNGFPRNVRDDVDARHLRPAKYRWTEHAERNAIYNAARAGTAFATSNVSCPRSVMDCARAIVQSGLGELIAVRPDFDHPTWGDDFRLAVSRALFEEAGVRLRWYEAGPN